MLELTVAEAVNKETGQQAIIIKWNHGSEEEEGCVIHPDLAVWVSIRLLLVWLKMKLLPWRTQ